MKRYIKLVISLAGMIMLESSFPAAAETMIHEGLLYTLYNNSTCKLGSTNAAENVPNIENTAEVVKVPSKIVTEDGDEYRVTGVNANAFKSSQIGEFDFSECIYMTGIGSSSFENAKASKITLPYTVTNIDNYAFNSPYLMTLVMNSVTPPGGSRNFLSPDFSTDGVIYVPAGSLTKYEKVNWTNRPYEFRPIGYYENLTMPEKLDVYVGMEKKITIGWAPDDAPFPGDVEWYIKENIPGKDQVAWLLESDEANSIIVQPTSPGVCTLVARVRVEELDKDRYEELETKFNITYMPVEQLTFDPPEYTFEKTGGIY
ncbi:MAG: leucine-rich repeat domain-containing protein, partial [Muribaculaceae bacterium]|nr:leucine-rich repeat domain-containing protein [Muribaculaceae bacterium]